MIYFSETFSFKGEINLKCKQMKWRKKNLTKYFSRHFKKIQRFEANVQKPTTPYGITRTYDSWNYKPAFQLLRHVFLYPVMSKKRFKAMISFVHELNKIKPLANALACVRDRFQGWVNLSEDFALVVSPLFNHSGSRLNASDRAWHTDSCHSLHL